MSPTRKHKYLCNLHLIETSSIGERAKKCISFIKMNKQLKTIILLHAYLDVRREKIKQLHGCNSD